MTATSPFPDGPAADAGEPANVKDLRAEFERLSRLTIRDAAAERAFIEARIEMIRGDEHLNEADWSRLIEELRRRL